jgi:hypothetical protein
MDTGVEKLGQQRSQLLRLLDGNHVSGLRNEPVFGMGISAAISFDHDWCKRLGNVRMIDAN